jgi:heavy metal sensor kinase
MNVRSIHFRLTLYQSCLIALALLIFALASYLGFRRHLIRTLEAQCASQTAQIAESLLAGLPVSGIAYVQDEIQEHYSPESNNLFIRIVSSKGTTLYESGSPRDQSFTPPKFGFLPNLKEPKKNLDGRGHKLIYLYPYSSDSGESYQIQLVASLLPLEGSLSGLWKVGMLLLPAALSASVIGGFFLSKRSLAPVREIVATARHINSSNLRARLTENQTGDEIEDLAKTLNQMFERLEASFRQMIRFTADASHELRTPLTVVRGNLELLLRQKQVSKDFPNEDHSEILSQTLEETERLSKVVSQLMELAQLDSREIELEREPFDLTELVATTADQMQLLAEDKGVKLHTELKQELVVRADRYRIKQVLLNLIDNAIKYCPVGSEVYIKLLNDHTSVVLEVIDNGPGIPSDSLYHLFDRFYRIDRARSRELGGSGLGLSICKSICEAHGGTIEVSSPQQGGSTFRVVLPSSMRAFATVQPE